MYHVNNYFVSLHTDENKATLSKTTAWRKRKKAHAEAKEMAKCKGMPSPKKVRQAYTCKKCHKPQTKETGHSQYYGEGYCPNEHGQIPREEWLKSKAVEN